MKVTMNGRDLRERMDLLAQREEQCFKVVESAGVVVIGVIVLVCLSFLLDYFTGISIDHSPNRIIDAFKALR